MNIMRGDIYYADLSGWIGSEQGGLRPVLVVQNDIGNKFSPTVITVSITSRLNKAKLPTHIEISHQASELQKDSVVLCEQVRTLDKSRLKNYVSSLNKATMVLVDQAISISFGLAGRG